MAEAMTRKIADLGLPGVCNWGHPMEPDGTCGMCEKIKTEAVTESMADLEAGNDDDERREAHR